MIITRYSQQVFKLKLIKKSILNSNELLESIETYITVLPGAMLSGILSQDLNKAPTNMTIITDILEFNNTTDKISQKNNLNNLNKRDHTESTGSFCIKNEII